MARRRSSAWEALVCLVGLLALGLACLATSAGAETARLEAGLGTAEITPTHATVLGGYAWPFLRRADRALDPLEARALVVRSADETVAIVSLDLIGTSRRLHATLTHRLVDLHLDRLVLAATHTHHGPGGLTEAGLWRLAMGRFDEKTYLRVAAGAEAAVRRAHADLARARITYGRADARGLARNRRGQPAAVDPTLGVLRIDSPEGAPRGVLVHFAAHPTILPATLRQYSAEWPGAMRRAIERALPGSTALLLQGPLGDISPAVPAGEDDAVARMTRYGDAVAAVALAARDQADGAVNTLEILPDVRCPAFSVVSDLLGFAASTNGASLAPPPTELVLSRVRLGRLELRTVPGEPTHDAGHLLGRGAAEGEDPIWVVACAQDHVGYFTDRAGFRRGGYEAEMSFFGPDVVDRMRDALAGRPVEAPRHAEPVEGKVVAIRAAPGEAGPRGLGLAHGRLLGPQIRALLADAEPVIEDETLGGGGRLVLAPLTLASGLDARAWVVPLLVRAARTLQRHVPAEYLDEMEGVARGAGVPYDAILLENVFLTLAEQPNPLSLLTLPARCTNVVATGDATSMGQLLHGSTLDWGMREVLRPRTRALVMEPATGHPFVSVTWPGMVGTLRAMGAQGLSLTEESCAAPGDSTLDGVPVNLLMRQVVQHAGSLDEAVRLLTEAPGTCGYKITVADGRALDARVVEVTARQHQVRRPRQGLLFGCDPDAPDGDFTSPRAAAIPPSDGSSRRRYPAARAYLEPRRQKIRVGDVQGALQQRTGGILNAGTLFAVLFEPQIGRYHLALGDDVRADQGELRWHEEDLLASLSPERRAAYLPPWPVDDVGEAEVQVRVESLAGLRVEQVVLTSPVPSGIEANQRIEAELFTPADPRGVLIQLPHWKDPSGPQGQRLLALVFTRMGFAVLLLPLPYQYGRAPDGYRTGELTLSSDLARTREAALQGAADIARAGLWLERARGYPPERQGLLGVSLGGHVASLALGAYPERFAGAALLLAGSHVDGALFRRNGITDHILEELERRGVTPEEARSLVRAIDPAAHARPALAERVLLVAGDADPVVPKESAEALARAWGGARTLWYPGGHYDVIRHAGTVLQEVGEHFRTLFGSP